METLLARWQNDCHLRGLHANPVYRDLFGQLEKTRDTAVIARLKRAAWQHKEQGELSLKLFTSWLTRAKVREATLISAPQTDARQVNGVTRTFIIAQPLLHRVSALAGATIGAFNQQLNGLPRQEQNRVRAAVVRDNEPFYARVRDGLNAELRKSSPSRLRYFKWAFYGDNKPEHPFHLLTPDDQAAAWALLKELASTPPTATQPQTVPPLVARARVTPRRTVVRVQGAGQTPSGHHRK